ncbi:endonuclease/exonuclease/phosphatase family protein [Arenicella xantha]|uniref:Endonuclease/exonuclease/phosphatase family metal-dependent hydrolase n=1 Tax=Arenicella xantha TaxID=644221 RepID=A0A395JEQ8_9GAMM|nr:endonuclease/exonuclease/phosphatase family protein [Arenicella xantha]RBP47093.1 endonuclease/exonuclease/phosphatase family metal-dependent hydrolase [Arenicella xantha]
MLIRLIVFAVIIGLILAARKSKPAHNKAGTNFNGDIRQAAQEPAQIQVATYNIQTGKSLQGKRDLLASAKVLSQADLVGVQEVYAPSLMNLIGSGFAQTPRIANYGGFAWLFSATRRRWLREHRGNAILSKLPTSNWQVVMLPDQSNKSFRNMTIVEVAWQGQTFTFINTHLHTRNGREQQMKVVLQEFAKHPRAILVGDFNSPATLETLANALKDIDITDAIAMANLDTSNPQRIDWILTKGFKVEGGEMLEKGVSDHPYYQVSLTYK